MKNIKCYEAKVCNREIKELVKKIVGKELGEKLYEGRSPNE